MRQHLLGALSQRFERRLDDPVANKDGTSEQCTALLPRIVDSVAFGGRQDSQIRDSQIRGQLPSAAQHALKERRPERGEGRLKRKCCFARWPFDARSRRATATSTATAAAAVIFPLEDQVM